MEGSNGWMVYLVLAGAAVVGYFVVCKVIDYFSSIQSNQPDLRPPSKPDQGDLIGGWDPKKPIE